MKKDLRTKTIKKVAIIGFFSMMMVSMSPKIKADAAVTFNLNAKEYGSDSENYYLDDTLEFTVIDEDKKYVSVKYALDESYEEYDGYEKFTIPSKVIKDDVEYSVVDIEDFTNYEGASLVIPDTVSTISDTAFKGCTYIENIVVSEGNNDIKVIDGVLYKDKGKTLIFYPLSKEENTFTVPDEVTGICSEAFVHSYSKFNAIKTLNLGAGIKDFEPLSLNNCGNLTSLTVSENNAYFSAKESVLFDKTGRELLYYLPSKEDTCYNISKEVVKIGNQAFENAIKLEEITVEENVENVGEKAFANCQNLKKISFLGVITLGKEAFSRDTSLEEVTLPDNLETIDDEAFYGCSSLKEIIIPASVKNIGKNVFFQKYNSNSLKKVTMKTFYKDESLPVLAVDNNGKINSFKGLEISGFEAVFEVATQALKDLLTSAGISPENINVDSGLIEKTKKQIADEEAGKAVNELINTIGEVTYQKECKEKIDEALKAYEEEIEKDKEAGEEVFLLIKKIGKVKFTKECKNLIDRARNAYDLLTDKQKAYVKNIEILEKAEKTYKKLQEDANKKKVVTLNGITYELNKNTVIVKSSQKNIKKAIIPAKIKIAGKFYKVTKINAKAFSGRKQLKTIIIGENINTIEKEAFSNTSALSLIHIKTKNLTSKKIDNKAFYKAGGKNYKKLVIISPKGKKNIYNRILIKKGINKKSIFK
ncbi:Leucine rich repeat-containing protein [Acetitomaculum ruminis DSM 5522]|uniref:Leucine rich repeat-containing protein n=1 Tax=Acetitomaculum ruminis DSM 5522 TaxID=1120918 RepID=A0A1I0X7B8_9FIRM|nr:leucine-rich repeat domain-containing protein [Acetitomaculum ruminis]SFA96939.1 Leucine rich repeat-containing protein [Acetitomaculum ruminis DSM 5522]